MKFPERDDRISCYYKVKVTDISNMLYNTALAIHISFELFLNIVIDIIKYYLAVTFLLKQPII